MHVRLCFFNNPKVRAPLPGPISRTLDPVGLIAERMLLITIGSLR